MSDSLPDQDREQRWALVIRQHIFLMGGGRDEQPPSCGCGEWQARSLNYNIGHREWAQHLASAVMPLADAEAAGLRERLTRAEERLAAVEQTAGMDVNVYDRGQFDRHVRLALRDPDAILNPTPQVTLSADENGTRDGGP